MRTGNLGARARLVACWLVSSAALAAAVSCDAQERGYTDGAGGESDLSSGASSGGSSGKGGSAPGSSGNTGGGAQPVGGESGKAGTPNAGGSGSDGGAGGSGATGTLCHEHCFCEGEYCATVKEVDAGADGHTCALTSSGNVWCWGENASGEVGVPGFSDEGRPKRVESMTDVLDVAVGGQFTCALKTGGSVWCWGSNEGDQLGDNGGVATVTYLPVQVLTAPATPLTGIAAIAAGSHTCALKDSDGSVWCWGSGHLGNNTNAPSPVAVQVVQNSGEPVIGASKIFTGGDASGAFYSQNWYAWGSPPSTGQVSDDFVVRATAMSESRPYVSIDVGASNGCGIDPMGDLYCWPSEPPGKHDKSPLFDGNAAEVAVGYYHYCVLKTDGVVACFGDEYENGGLGDGPGTSSDTPVDILTDVRHLSGSVHHGCVVRNDETVWCWGRNYHGQVGNGSVGGEVDVPTAVLPVPSP